MKKKLEHIWYYYKWYILAAALVLLVAANFIGELGQRRQPDGVVSIVTISQVPEETVEKIRTLFETLWGDRNQDGVTDVEVNVYAYDGMGYSGGSADDYAAAAVHLASEIQAGTTDLFLSDAEELMRQAERLQYYGAFGSMTRCTDWTAPSWKISVSMPSRKRRRCWTCFVKKNQRMRKMR